MDDDFVRDMSEYKATAAALIAANVLPLLGVLFLGWDAFAIIALYWCENVIIGAINVLKILACRPDPEVLHASTQAAPQERVAFGQDAGARAPHADAAALAGLGSKLAIVAFFVIHYGLFCLVHGMFVFNFFGRQSLWDGRFWPVDFFDVFTEERLWWAVAALAASHLYSFFVNYIGRGEYRHTSVPQLMAQPYARVVVLHLAILFGGFVTMAVGGNMGALLLLIAGKTALDLSLHLSERRRNEVKRAARPTGGVVETL